MKKLLFLSLVFVGFHLAIYAQNIQVAWDDPTKKNWEREFKLVQIKSTVDNSLQNVWFYKSKNPTPQPLIISLHTWSGDYNQEDPLAKEVLLRDWNYIHPDFRGPNNNPKACGSNLVISDIEDAIRFAIKQSNVDTTNVHIIGASGGGYAAMLAYMRIGYPVKSFHAWVGISNLSDWYWESKGRNARYATDLEQVAMKDNQMNWEELDSRSPIKLPFPADKRKNASLDIYAGIHDGYTGSVPISHSVLFYNKIAAELYPVQKDKLVADSILLSILAKQLNPFSDNQLTLGDRKIHLLKQSPELTLTLFEGGHEMIVPQALALIPVNGERNTKKMNILTIGDSNAAAEFGWPAQLGKLLPFSTVINKSISGNTIGFDNLEQEKLNTLKNIDRYLDKAYAELSKDRSFDYILIGLGTNDAKRIFEKRQKEVPENMVWLIEKIRRWANNHQRRVPDICIISPPPVDEQKANTEKYGGGDKRVRKLIASLKIVSEKEQTGFLDSYSVLRNGFENKTSDGIHLNEEAQFTLAQIISDYLRSFE